MAWPRQDFVQNDRMAYDAPTIVLGTSLSTKGTSLPTWGLTTTTRQMLPYGLKAWWLEPGKVITDPIHGDIFITRIEQLMLDTPPMQRLRRVRQLGTTHLVYPGATHTRFSHSLGAVRVVQTLFDAAHDQRNQNHPTPDLFTEWEELAIKAESDADGIPEDVKELADDREESPWQIIYQRKVAEATVLARLGALLHDIGHLPFGHTIEDDLDLLTPHDEGSGRLRSIWQEAVASWSHQMEERLLRDHDLPTAVLLENLSTLEGGRLYEEIEWLILSSRRTPAGEKQSAAEKLEYPFVADLVGNTICADLLDYLERDHVFTGLPLSLGSRYLSSFYVTPVRSGGLYKGRMALTIARNGRERKDVVTEILKHLRYRYELQERVLVHHTKIAADAMVGKMFELWLEGTEGELLGRKGALTEMYSAVPPNFKNLEDTDDPSTPQAKASCVARFRLEQLLLDHGDDGVLESIKNKSHTTSHKAAAELATALLSRDLYKQAANAINAAAAEDLYDRFGSHEARRTLELAACAHAEISCPWHVVIWIPDPRMRLKLAELLVDDERGVAKFKDKSSRGSDIYEAHKSLWTISVFMHPSVTPTKTVSALAKLSQELAVSWDTHSRELGPVPTAAPEHLGAVRFLRQSRGEAKVRELVAVAQSDQIAARGTLATQSDLDATIAFIGERRGITPT